MPYNYIEETGVIVPDTSQTKTTVEEEYRALFGDDLIIDDESPEGLIINAEVEQRDALAKNNADLANQINPNLAGGTFLDSIFALTDGERDDGIPSTFTTPPFLTGVANTLIPAGTQARTVNGDLFESTADLTLDVNGEGSVAFQSVEDAAIQVGIGELDQIETEVLGWETITNLVAATPGRTEQSDQGARRFRRGTLARQTISIAEAVFSNVLAVDDVTSLTFRENVTSSDAVIDGKLLLANSIYVCVAGGTDSDVAQALLRSKSSGSNWTGDIDIDVIEEISGQQYTVRLDRPTDIPVQCEITVSAGASVQDPQQAVRDSILRYANGEIQGELGFVVGGSVSPFELSGAVNIDTPEIQVRNCLVSTVANNNNQPTEIPIAIFQQASITSANIVVNIV